MEKLLTAEGIKHAFNRLVAGAEADSQKLEKDVDKASKDVEKASKEVSGVWGK